MTMTRKTRRAFLGTAALTSAIGITGAATASSDAETITFEETFDDPTREWQFEADASADVEFGSDWSIERSDARAASGSQSLEYTVDATEEFATIWAYTEVDVERGQSYDVEVNTQFWNQAKSYNQLSKYRAYFGPEKPETVEDFPSGIEAFLMYSDAAGLEKNPWEESGWTEYPMFWQTPELETDTLYLALAVQPAWETTVEHAIDDVSVQMEPRT